MLNFIYLGISSRCEFLQSTRVLARKKCTFSRTRSSLYMKVNEEKGKKTKEKKKAERRVYSCKQIFFCMTHKSGDVGCDLRRPASPRGRVDTHAKFHSRKCHVRLNVSNNIPGTDRNRGFVL